MLSVASVRVCSALGLCVGAACAGAVAAARLLRLNMDAVRWSVQFLLHAIQALFLKSANEAIVLRR